MGRDLICRDLGPVLTEDHILRTKDEKENVVRQIVVILALSALFPNILSAKGLEEGGIYRLSITVELEEIDLTWSCDHEKCNSNGNNNNEDDDKSLDGNRNLYIAAKNSKFNVVKERDEGGYFIRFNKIYDADQYRYPNKKEVTYDRLYFFKEKYVDQIEPEKITTQSSTGLSGGPLVVPFKYRTNSDSLSGEATIGMYAGMTFEPGCTKSNWCFRITPLLSAGFSQATDTEEEELSQKTSVTWAAGFLITDWDDINIGLLYGEDRTGDEDWEHEGEGWISFMIGWEL